MVLDGLVLQASMQVILKASDNYYWIELLLDGSKWLLVVSSPIDNNEYFCFWLFRIVIVDEYLIPSRT